MLNCSSAPFISCLIIEDSAANCIHDTLWAAFLVLSHIPGVPGEWAIESHISRCRPLFTILPHFIQTGVQSHRRLTASAFQLDFTAEERNWPETEKWRKPKLTFSTEWEMGNWRMNGESRLRCWAANKYILSRLCYIRAEVLWFYLEYVVNKILTFGEGVSSEFYIHRIVWLKMVLSWLHVAHWRYE